MMLIVMILSGKGMNAQHDPLAYGQENAQTATQYQQHAQHHRTHRSAMGKQGLKNVYDIVEENSRKVVDGVADAGRSVLQSVGLEARA